MTASRANRNRSGKLSKQILAALNRGPLTTREIALLIKMPVQVTANMVARLADRDLIRHFDDVRFDGNSYWRWALPAAHVCELERCWRWPAPQSEARAQ